MEEKNNGTAWFPSLIRGWNDYHTFIQCSAKSSDGSRNLHFDIARYSLQSIDGKAKCQLMWQLAKRTLDVTSEKRLADNLFGVYIKGLVFNSQLDCIRHLEDIRCTILFKYGNMLLASNYDVIQEGELV